MKAIVAVTSALCILLLILRVSEKSKMRALEDALDAKNNQIVALKDQLEAKGFEAGLHGFQEGHNGTAFKDFEASLYKEFPDIYATVGVVPLKK